MASPIKKPKRQLSIPSTGLGGKRSRTSSPSRVATNTGAAHPNNIIQSATDPGNHLLGGEPEPSAPNCSTRRNEDPMVLVPQGMTQSPPVTPAESTPNRNATEASWAGLEKALAALHITTKICPPLYSAIEGLKSCVGIFEEAARSHRDYKELATGLTAMVELLIKHMPIAASREIMEVLKSIAKKIEEELESIDKRQCRTGPGRILRASKEDEDIVRRYRRIEQLFRQLQAEASMSTWDVTKRHHVDTQLEKLGPVKLANYNSKISMDIGRRACTENTRTKILSDSMKWADNPNGAKIYWLNGMAGTGKTTIGYSLCERLEAEGQLAASFFCTRTSRECGEAKQIVPTIAYQLARRSAPFRDALCKILDNNPDIGTLNTTSQFDSLLAKPLVESRELMERNLVIVIDALDECNDPHAVKIVLDILFRYASSLPVKFFVTSRPEPIIRNSMMIGITESNRAQSILYLHEIEKSLVQADIELYLRDELEHMLPTHRADIEELAEQAGNLFIYAATAVRYIRPGGKAVNSRQRPKTILQVNNKSKKSMSDIDLLYSAILSAAIDDDGLEPEEQESVKTVLWTAICACEPVLIDTLAALCELDDTDLAGALQPLRSVLHVSDHNNLVTTLHASFPDFMFSEERSKLLFCNRSSHDMFLAKRCLAIMKSQLRFNICKIESSFCVDDEIDDLEKRVEQNISQELFYASRFWVDHLSQGEDPNSSPVMGMVHEFLSQQLLFWMEVLNLNKCMVAGAVASTKVHMWLRNSHAPSDLVVLARDAQTFVGSYAAHQSDTLNILAEIQRVAVWTSDYPIRSASFSGDRKYIAIGDDNGTISVRHSHSGKTLIKFQAHREVISFVSFSSDAALIASSSHDHTVCIWKVSDGSLAFKPFRGHTDRVNSITFSPHGMYLASGSDDSTIRIWTTRGPSYCQSILAGHISAVRSVMFSPDGMLIVSGSNDHTVYIWDALSGKLLRTLRGHTGSISCVRFSPCGTFIVSSSLDKTIRIWDTHTGAPIGNPFLGHSNLITSIAVSPEGERIASGSLDRTVIVWHRRSGEIMAGPFVGHTGSVRSVEFSADGAWIVSASEDRTVRLWNAQGGNDPSSTEKTESATWRNISGFLLAISPDGAYVAFGHPNNNAISVWDIRLTAQVAQAHLPTASIYGKMLLLTFSSDNRFIFMAYQYGVVASLLLGTDPPIQLHYHRMVDVL
ncbi:putative WD repeat-containing protein alr2800 [Nostoc sp, PCC 7120] [Rhizoctonia solani]|uniref:Putative WD repeat-containing protein alr2800 [Nostoc sp, PCC 7120] n=1 Tax=Rhizoctonia solani TaxID=456999 RepID=A0A0K6FTF9_9AGAM|nr:putative WD repeat-containing protein alr2800 [Nostoc sp, PCC 7120] [Rhizoctonia solani]